jgi:hypothetical protein
VQGCLIVGSGSSGSDVGIEIENSASGVQVINNRLLECNEGVYSNAALTAAGNGIIHNYVANCLYGLVLNPNDKYQDNVVTSCTTPFFGGIAVGNNNG